MVFRYKNKRYIDDSKNIQIIANKKIFSLINDFSFEQLNSISSLPNIKSIYAMPDIHPGYGVPIGSTFSFNLKNALISPEAVGFDINCGVRLIKTNIYKKDLSKEDISQLIKNFKQLPLGLSDNGIKITDKDYKEILTNGIDWAINNNYCKPKNKKHIYNHGKFENADYKKISKEAYSRGKKQLGTLGQGNHFIDLVYIYEVFNKDVAKKFGLDKNQLCILLHTGSRGLGHQIGLDYLKKATNKEPFSYFKFDSQKGQDYYKAMNAAANYAFVNRDVLSYRVQDIMINTLNKKINFYLLYDLSHNLSTIETHNKDKQLVCRKGATRVFPSSRLLKSSVFKQTGAPIILPGSMLDYSYILTPGKNTESTLDTVAHGSGRSLSRKDAKQKISFEDLKSDLEKKGVYLSGRSQNLAREEQPEAYKASKQVVSSLEQNGLVKKIVKLKPLIVLTG